MEFQSYINDAVDVRQYKSGWLINDVDYLTEDITDDDVAKMERALVGEIEENPVVGQFEDIRDEMLWRTRRFHFVEEASWPSENGKVLFLVGILSIKSQPPNRSNMKERHGSIQHAGNCCIMDVAGCFRRPT
jgi:hypothetical protein